MIHQLALMQLFLSDKITTSWNMGPNKHQKFISFEKLVMIANFQEDQLQPFLVFFNFI